MSMGWNRKLQDGKWRAWESVGSGPDRIRANATGPTQRAAVAAALAKAHAKAKAAAYLEPDKLSLSDYCTRWITHLKTQGRSAKSVARYESICDKLPKDLSRRMLTELKPLHFQHWLDGLAGKESPATTRKRYTVLHAAMSRAVAWRLVIDNPLEAVTPPKVTKGQASAVDEDATAALLKSVAGTRYEYPALVAVTTGVRRGELLALRWTDLDLKTGTMRVRRRADEVPKTHVVFKEGTKTGGTRSVSLMAGTITALKAHRAAQAAERLAAKRWREHGLIFPDIHGEAWRPSTFSVGWGRLKTGLRFHDLRHTHATQLLRAGVPVDAVSKRLGHASPVITMTIYAHVLEDADASAVDRLEATLGRALSAVSGTQSDIS